MSDVQAVALEKATTPPNWCSGPERDPATVAGSQLGPFCCLFLFRAVVCLLEEDYVRIVTLQKVEIAAPFVFVPQAVAAEHTPWAAAHWASRLEAPVG